MPGCCSKNGIELLGAAALAEVGGAQEAAREAP